MSDSKSSLGEPVEEPNSDDVVGRAQEGLADAEAALKEAGEAVASTVDDAADDVTTAEPSADDSGAESTGAGSTPSESAVSGADDAAASTDTTSAASSGSSAFDGPEISDPAAFAAELAASRDTPEPEAATAVYPAGSDAETTVLPGAAEQSPVTPEPSLQQQLEPVLVNQAGQPIFVTAPEAPRPRGNRAGAGAIGLVATIVFAVLYLAAWLGLQALSGAVTVDNMGTALTTQIMTWQYWVPVAVFFLAFWLLGAMINRGRWGVWVHLGVLIAAISYGGYLLGQLFQAPFWKLTSAEGVELIQANLLAPLAIVTFILAREISIWFGAWVAARGRRLNELNREAQREYERTLEAGPQLPR